MEVSVTPMALQSLIGALERNKAIQENAVRHYIAQIDVLGSEWTDEHFEQLRLSAHDLERYLNALDHLSAAFTDRLHNKLNILAHAPIMSDY